MFISSVDSSLLFRLLTRSAVLKRNPQKFYKLRKMFLKVFVIGLCVGVALTGEFSCV